MTVEATVQVAEQTLDPKKLAGPKIAENTTEAAEKASSTEELKALAALPEVRTAAETALAAGHFFEAVDKLSTASEMLAKTYGPLSPKCAEILLMYGRALYNLASEQRKVAREAANLREDKLASVVATGDVTVGMSGATKETGAAPSQSVDGESTVVEDEGAAEGEADEEEKDEDAVLEINEEKDDLQVAFEILDTARVVLSKMEGEAAQRMLAETHMLLGDVSFENEDFARAASDFSSGLEVAAKVYPSTDRTIPYVHFKLATALEWNNEVTKAVEEVQKAIDILKLRAEHLASGKIKVSHDVDAEIKEINELIPEIESKAKELKDTPVLDTLAADDLLAGKAADMFKSRKADVAEFLAQRFNQSAAACVSGGAASPTTRKRKAEVNSADNESKKSKEINVGEE